MKWNDRLTLQQAAALIAERDRRSGDTEKSARDRARKRLSYAMGVAALPSWGDYVQMDDLGSWLRNKFPGRFDDLPYLNAGAGVAIGKSLAVGESLSAVDSFDAVVLPGDLARCHDEILNLVRRCADLQSALNRAQRELEVLRPDADKFRAMKAKLRASAQKPRQRR